MNRRIAFHLLRSLLFLLPVALVAQPKPVEVIILHTNDMHSKIDNMAKLAYLADSLRQNHPWVFLVSSGDNFTGNPVVDMVPEKGYPMIDLMNRCGFNASALGNHEFDMGQTMLKKRTLQARFPFVCCNMESSTAVIGQLRPYTVIKAGEGVSIALLGILQLDENGLPSAHPSNMQEVLFTNGIAKAKEYAWLKKEHGILIALSHLGLPDDIRLADSVPQIDVIMGGHSHTTLESPRYENGVMIVQAGSNLKYVGKTTLTITDGKITGRADELIPFTVLKSEDRGVRALIDMYNSNPEFNTIAGTAAQPIEGEDELGSLMADAVTATVGADITLQNRGGIRISSIAAGAITLKDVYKLDPFNNPVVLISMTPDELGSLLCYGYRHEKAIDFQVSGMSYRITDDGKNGCASIEMTDSKGQPLDTKRTYKVALSNYVASTYKFDHKDPGTTAAFTTSEAMIKFLKEKKQVDYKGIRRAFLVR